LPIQQNSPSIVLYYEKLVVFKEELDNNLRICIRYFKALFL